MNWKRTLLLWAALGGSLSFFTVARAATPAIADDEVPRYLDAQQATQWNDAQKKLKDATAKLEEGNKLVKEVQDPSSLVKLDIEKDHAKGTAIVKDATQARNDANRTLGTLRRAAIENRNKTMANAKATAALTYTMATAQWPEAVASMTKGVLAALAEQRYKHVYVGGVYSFGKDAKYTARPALAAQVAAQLAQLDKNKVFSASPDDAFKLGQDNGKLIISYPDRAANGTSKSAAIFGEVVFEPRSGYAAVALRAVDLNTMRIVASQAMMLSVEPSLAKLIGLAAYDVPSKRIQPAPENKAKSKDEDDSGTAPAVTVNLQDPDDVLGKAAKANSAFGVATAGHKDALPNRFAILAFKSYLVDQRKDLQTSDVDFLTLAVPTDKPGNTATVPANLVGVWMLPNLDDLSSTSISLDPVKAHDLGTNADLPVGKLTIERNLPKLTYPSSDELKAGGY
ncbi:MAG TPA: hypothetical protein VHC95_02970 [Opitutales bacterium]|nr:hypothetical protein [Opitutales bacterium]